MKGFITSMKDLDLSSLTYKKLCWKYGTSHNFSKGKRSDKVTWNVEFVMTEVGEIQEDVWYQLAEYLIQREHEEELFNQLLQFESETTHNSCFKRQDLRHHALDLFVYRIFDQPGWVDFIHFNRKYRPEFIKNMNFIRIKSECCGAIGEITKEQIHVTGAPCPKCGRFAPFVTLDTDS